METMFYDNDYADDNLRYAATKRQALLFSALAPRISFPKTFVLWWWNHDFDDFDNFDDDDDIDDNDDNDADDDDDEDNDDDDNDDDLLSKVCLSSRLVAPYTSSSVIGTARSRPDQCDLIVMMTMMVTSTGGIIF